MNIGFRNRRIASVCWLFAGATGLLPHAAHAQTSQGPTWTPIAAAGPLGRMNLAMCDDTLRGRVVLYGGEATTQAFGDTWEWDGTTWLPQIFATGPGARWMHAMAFDAARGNAVLFGGRSGSTNRGDTWTWNGTQWTLAATSGPSPRIEHSMAYDSQRRRVVLFGGVSTAYLGDTWEWDGASWLLRSSSGGPSPRGRAPMCYDSKRGRIVLFSGQSGSGTTRDTWEWNGASWQLRSNSGPSDRSGVGMAFDEVRGTSVLYGGTTSLVDTWEWNGTTWSLLPSQLPGYRSNSAMARDAQRRTMVVFGGQAGTNVFPTETLVLAYRSGAVAYGAGCGNPNLTLAVPANSVPALGAVARIELQNVPSTFAHVTMGWSRTRFGYYPLPLTLEGFGMTGCQLLQSSEFSAPALPTGAGSGVFDLAIPNWGGLLGIRLHLQAWSPAAGANAAGVIASNGVEWAIGNS